MERDDGQLGMVRKDGIDMKVFEMDLEGCRYCYKGRYSQGCLFSQDQ